MSEGTHPAPLEPHVGGGEPRGPATGGTERQSTADELSPVSRASPQR